ncbi:unnamed protein product, partial [Mesorhabditis spiculigera]
MNVESINKRLQQEEEWLRTLDQNLKKSAQLRNDMTKVLDQFGARLQKLQVNVMGKHEKNGRLQKRQQNIQRLIKTIDTTFQFFGKTNELETKIRDGSPSQDLEAYIESMESLYQAIAFFENYPEKRGQVENMRMTLESGFDVIEREFRDIISDNSMKPNMKQLSEGLDENGDLLSGYQKTIQTIKNSDKIARVSSWLLSKGREPRFLNHLANIRGENMRQALAAVYDQEIKQQNAAGTRMLKMVPKRAGRGEKAEKEHKHFANAYDKANVAHLLFGCFLALVTVEEGVLEKILDDVTVRAQVHRGIISKPLAFCIRISGEATNAVDSLLSFLPLMRFLDVHQNQLVTLASNSDLEAPFEQMMRTLRIKCTALLNESVDKLKTEVDKFVPEDGNVHPLTANTLNLLCNLTLHRQTVTQQLLAPTASSPQNTHLLLPKLFARILSALGTCLSRKSELYPDPLLSTIFMINNYTYIAKSLQDEEDALLPVISEQNHQILEFYLSEIGKYEQEYLKSWQGIVSILVSADRVHDRNSLGNILYSFNRDLDAVISRQRLYCISDNGRVQELRGKIKTLLGSRYKALVERCRSEGVDGKLIRYSVDDLAGVIDKLFSPST